MTTKTLPRETMLEILDEESNEFVLIENKYIEKTRWEEVRRIIFKDKDGTYWQAIYSQGLTEMQDVGPWEFEDNVEINQVKPVEVTYTEYKLVN